MIIDLKFAILKIISKSPMHGYVISKTLEEKLNKKTSPGSLYPALNALEKDDLITSTSTVEHGKFKKIYMLTPKGKEFMRKKARILEDFLGW